MTRLRGEFTMMLMVRLPQDIDANALSSRLTASTRLLDLAVLCRALPGQAAVRHYMSNHRPHFVGLRRRPSPALWRRSHRPWRTKAANITDMNTRVIGSGEAPVYVMVLELQLPQGRKSDPLKQALDALKPVLGVDLTLRPLSSATF